MKKIKLFRLIKILSIILLLSSCSQQQKLLREERKSWEFNNWKNNFKDRALCLCMIEGYENKDIKEYIKKYDKSYFSGIGIAVFDPALKPVIEREVTKMRTDSIESIIKVPEHIVGKRIFEHCLEFYKSKRLDSIAKSQMVEWKKINNLQERIWKYIPTY